jgi:quercetin dioxygenase-like cupin family protein
VFEADFITINWQKSKQGAKMKRHYWMFVSLFAAGISVGIVGSAAIHAQQAGSPTRQILKADLQGAGQETLFFTTDWAPGQTLPCHIHPEGHEFAYLIEGELTFNIKGVGEKVVKAGEINHVLPDIPHYGRNASDKLAKTLVVRVKDKSKPIAVDVEASNCP